MQSATQVVQGVFRVVFLQGSPERIHYSRGLFVGLLFSALTVSAAVQHLFFNDHVVFVILRVFAELVPFMLGMVWLTAKIARFRLARMMLVLVCISVLMDAVLLLLAGFVSADALPAAPYVVGGIALYGAANVVRWGLASSRVAGAVHVGLYWVAVLLLDQAFRGLYNIMAGS